MLHTSVSGLRGNADMKFLCTTRSCEGQDQYTQTMFRALQAQINRYLKAIVARNPGVASIILDVDGKLGATTVSAYKLVAGGLASGGVQLPVREVGATKEALAQQADSVSRSLQAVADRAGLPPAAVTIPGVPSGTSAGTPSGVVVPGSAPNTTANLLNALVAKSTQIPPEPGIPHTELVTGSVPGGMPGFGPFNTSSPTPSSGGPNWAMWGAIGAATGALFYFTVRKRKQG